MASELEEAAKAPHELVKKKALQEGEAHKSPWFAWVALSTTVMALLSALGTLLAGVTANEVMVERTEEILEVSRLEADRINIELLKSKHAILMSLGETVDHSELERIREYHNEIEELQAEVESEEAITQRAIHEHELFAIGVMLLSIAITLSGMALITKHYTIWGVGLVFGVMGASIVGMGIYNMIV